LLKRRPLTKEDIENMFDESSKNILENLLKKGEISLVDSGGLNFYKIL
jgi:chromosome segregation and condensation protein ScpB